MRRAGMTARFSKCKGFRLTDAASAQFVGEIFAKAVDDFVARFEAIDDEDVETLHGCAEAIGPWLLTRPAPFAVVHGDYRLDNLMFPPEGRGVSALDWQTVGVAPPGRDLAYFLGTALHPEDRRRCESDLVALYFDDLERRGVQGYSRQRMLRRLPARPVAGPIHYGAGMRLRSDGGTHAGRRRDVHFDGTAILRRHQGTRVALLGGVRLTTPPVGFLRDQRFRSHEDRRCLGKPDIGKSHEHDGPDVIRTHLTIAKCRFGVNREE